MERLYFGIDNGTTGSLGVRTDSFVSLIMLPVKKEQNYTKKENTITRIDVPLYLNIFKQFMEDLHKETSQCFVVIERPLVNPQLFSASLSAVRCLEATLIVLEQLRLAYTYVDDRTWKSVYREFSGKRGRGSKAQKEISRCVGVRLFPDESEIIQAHGDADGLLIAEWARRNNL